MSVYNQTVDVSGTAAYPSTPQVTIPFEPRRIVLLNEDTADDAYVSLDGQNDHVHLPANTGFAFNFQRVRGVWLKRGVAGTPVTDIQVVAES